MIRDVLARSRFAADTARSALDPGALALPLRVVVPSRSLREHLARTLVRAARRSVIGVRVQTLAALALEVLEQAGDVRPDGEPFLGVLVRRAAVRVPALDRALSGLSDGFGIVTESVRDLLDCGLEPESASQLLARLEGDGAELERARGIVEVACSARRELDAHHLDWRGERLRRASAHLGRDPFLLPASAIRIHGFADATGLASELLARLLERPDARLYLDRPPDALDRERVDAGARFGARFNERMTGSATAGAASSTAGLADPPTLRFVNAPGAHAEVRAVADAIARLLEDRVEPESVGIVARRLEPHVRVLRVELELRGIPFSGLGARAPAGPEQRRALGIGELLRRGPELPSDRWLGLLAPERLPRARASDVRVALHVLGAARLRDVASLDLDRELEGRDALALPVRVGFLERESEAAHTGDESGDDDGSGVSQSRRRRVGRPLLEAVRDAARDCIERTGNWPDVAPLGVHAKRLRRLVERDLGWSRGPSNALLDGLESASAQSDALDLSAAEWSLLVERALRDAGSRPLGGVGGGVQVLDATEARARTFEHLFVVGLNRDEFPRTIQEDALLPDALRSCLAPVLPQIPIKQAGFDEERFLFAQLVEASPHVTLSWQSLDEEGRARPPSPLVVRLMLERDDAEVETAPTPHGVADLAAGARTASEHAIHAGLSGGRGAYRERVARALAERGRSKDAAREARIRVSLLDELDPDLSTAVGRRRNRELGPHFGFVGAATAATDPRHGALWVTAMESLARCPWRTLLERVLKVERPPDALEALPDLSPLLIGTTVHAALEQIVERELPERPRSLADAARCEPVLVPWPEPPELEALVEAAAVSALREVGAALPGLARALALRALPFLERARERDWPDGTLATVGAELATSVDLGELGTLHFKADRVDKVGERLVLTDYKTGRNPFDARKAETRRRKLLTDVRRGVALQAPLYASADEVAAGRYLYLRPDLPPDAIDVRVASGDAEARSCLELGYGALIATWRHGAFFPRLAEPGDGRIPHACESCTVSTACRWGDSGARNRLDAWARREPAEASGSPAEEALRTVWRLPLARLEADA